MADLIKRLWTAIVLVPILVVSMFVDPTPWSILVLATIAGGLALDEFLRMALPVTADDRAIGLRVVMGAIGAAVLALPMIFGAGRVLPPLLGGAAILIALTLLARKRHLPSAGRHAAACFAGVLYVPLLASLWPQLKLHFSPGWLFVTLAVAFMSDTGAYAFGRLWGKHKLYPAVSPGKTWEGAVGGLVGANLATVGWGSLFLLPELSIPHAVVLGVVGSLAGQVGDLFESMLKRGYGVKDSGSLLPGHGGMLDRVDALLFVGPVVYYFATYVVYGGTC